MITVGAGLLAMQATRSDSHTVPFQSRATPFPQHFVTDGHYPVEVLFGQRHQPWVLARAVCSFL